MRNVFRTACVFLALSATACGKTGPALAPISGRIALGDAPLANATITFTPIDTKEGPPLESIGKTDEDGRYSLELLADKRPGAVPGTHTVRISLYDRGDGTKPGKGQQVPPDYNARSKLTFSVAEGGTKDANFALRGRLNQTTR